MSHVLLPCVTPPRFIFTIASSLRVTTALDDFADVPRRIATAAGDDALVFVVKNFCDGATPTLALVNYATMLLVVAGIMRINRHLKEQEVAFDEDEQTAQDYSVVIKNPPAQRHGS